ncbi:YtxH domain-containing protein [Pedobacter sp. KR3-3]|uniref:YtxH domain-containing protein n=1 Tax=Pedobacter albus TaxID=3113905 RepID=A0ABU7IAC7_9SPHI|nr:YtxH domain-containing protein [Pedobacter sp. KR3-3]MEE1946309.1 YtxH domain-containing protein [Pedobacter sp. KR3-3]
MTKQTKILAGVLAGAALGAVVALVVSSDRTDDIKGKVGDWFCDLLGSSKDKLSTMSELVKNTLSRAKA